MNKEEKKEKIRMGMMIRKSKEDEEQSEMVVQWNEKRKRRR